MTPRPRYVDRGVERLYTVLELLTLTDRVRVGGTIQTSYGTVRIVRIADRKPERGGVCVRVTTAGAGR